MGWPGSVPDTTVFRESEIWRLKARYFDDDEFILADKGLFLLSPYMINLTMH